MRNFYTSKRQRATPALLSCRPHLSSDIRRGGICAPAAARIRSCWVVVKTVMKLKTTRAVRSELRAGELHGGENPSSDEKASSSARTENFPRREFSATSSNLSFPYFVFTLFQIVFSLCLSLSLSLSLSLFLPYGEIGMKTLNSPTSHRNARFRRTAYRH